MNKNCNLRVTLIAHTQLCRAARITKNKNKLAIPSHVTQKALSKIPVLWAMVRTELHKKQTADGAIVCRCYEEVSSERYLGRQSAGLFALALYRDSFGISSLKMKQKVFQGVQFVVSHPATFYFRTRTHIKALYNLKIQGSVTVKEDGLITSWMRQFSERHFDSDGSSPDDKFMTSEDESTGYDSTDY